MKACIYHGIEQLAVEERERPVLPQGGAVAKILRASVCGTDLRAYRSGSDKIEDGRIIGHEACYLLEDISPEIKGYEKGERVIVAPAVGCGECRQCKKGKTNMCDTLKTIGFEWDGTFAQYCAIPAQAFRMGNVIRVPEHVSDVQACLAEPVACAINAQSYLTIGKGDAVLVFGAGYLGCIHAEIAFLSGAKQVIIAEISAKRRQQAQKDVKGVVTVDSSAPDFKEQIGKVTNGSGVDVVITACPAGITHKTGLELLNKLGRMSLFGGLAGDGHGFLDSNLIHYKEAAVYGVHASSAEHNKQALDLIATGKLDVTKYAQEYPMEHIGQAMKDLIAEDVVKAVLSCEK